MLDGGNLKAETAIEINHHAMNHPTFNQKETSSDVRPRVSIVLPTYNHCSFLPQLIQSIFAQTFTDFELIIVNDGSIDGTREYLDGLRDHRIRIIHQENQRLPRALNNGFKMALGDLFTWVSSDNNYDPFFLEALVAALDAHPEAAFAYSAFAWINEKDEVTHIVRDQDMAYHRLLAWNPGIASFMYRRICHDQIGLYNPNLEGAEDWDMWLRITERYQTVYIPEVLCYYRQHDKSMSASLSHKVYSSSRKTFTEALKRNHYQFKIENLYPSIDLCKDRHTARFHAFFDFGTTLLRSPFTPLGLSCQFLEDALSLCTDSVHTMSNLAVAYGRTSQWDKAMGLVGQLRNMGNTKAHDVCDAILEAYRTNRPDHLRDVYLFVMDGSTSELFRVEKRIMFSFTKSSSQNVSQRTPSSNHGRLEAQSGLTFNKPAPSITPISVEDSSKTVGATNGNIIKSEQLFHEGRFHEAEESIKEVLQVHPYHPQALNTFACILWKTGRTEQALTELSKAMEVAPDDGDIVWNVGQILIESGSSKDALDVYEHLLSKYPEDPAINEMVEILHGHSPGSRPRALSAQTKKPQIFYFCYDHQKPSGGQKQMYRHVDILNNHGYKSYSLHLQDGYRLSWFENNTNVLSLNAFQKIYHPERDYIVLPEDLGEKILSFPGKKIIFNQGVYLGFYSLGLKKMHPYPYLHPDIEGVIVVSEHNREYLAFAYPELKVYRTFNAVEHEKFTYQPIKNKKKHIACLPSKNPVDLSQIYHILSSRAVQGLNNLQDYQWIFIQDMSEIDVIQTLRDSLLFIFLSTEEGFPLMPLEAMLSGSLVVAYKAGPLAEFLSDENSFLCAKGDILGTARVIEEITQSVQTNGINLQATSRAALEKAMDYSLQKEEECVINVWKSIIGGFES